MEHELGHAVARDSKCDVLEHPGTCFIGFFETIRIRRIVAHPVIMRAVVQVRSTPRFLNDSTMAVDFQETPLVGIQGPDGSASVENRLVCCAYVLRKVREEPTAHMAEK